jgi:hypothetical protein
LISLDFYFYLEKYLQRDIIQIILLDNKFNSGLTAAIDIIDNRAIQSYSIYCLITFSTIAVTQLHVNSRYKC